MRAKLNVEFVVTVILMLVSAMALFYVYNNYPRLEKGYPSIALTVILGATLVHFIILLSRKPVAGAESLPPRRLGNLWRSKENRNILVTMAVSLAFVFAMNQLGFLVVSVLMIVLLPLYLGYRKLLPIILSGVICIGFVYFLFSQLYVPIPQGILAILTN